MKNRHPPQFFLSLYGWTFWVPILMTGAAAIKFCLIMPGMWWLATVFGLLTFACLAFYRDFPRSIPQGPNLMVAADGAVSEITHLEHYVPFNGPALKVGIFLSVLDVHVNRYPCDGVVLWTRYEEGLFLDARDPDCTSKNQSNTLCLASPQKPTEPIAVVKQIVGAIARRIIAPVTVGETFTRGQRFGMIAFGSRTELYVPVREGWKCAVKLGDHVKGGKDVMLTK